MSVDSRMLKRSCGAAAEPVTTTNWLQKEVRARFPCRN